jgi:hypothetical protein
MPEDDLSCAESINTLIGGRGKGDAVNSVELTSN